MRRAIVLCVLLIGLIFGSVRGWLRWRDRSSLGRPGETPGVRINKQPVSFANRMFDPASPPADMPPLSPGEEAECDSNFLSSASVGGQAQQTDATHALVTITQIQMSLQLNVSIWVPTNVTQHVIEHEQGHRQISEYYYQTADQLAERIAAKYIGEKVEVAGTDLSGESNKLFQQVAAEITGEYNKELNPEPTQLRYDSMTDHGRNEVAANDGVAAAVKSTAIEPPQPATNRGN